MKAYYGNICVDCWTGCKPGDIVYVFTFNHDAQTPTLREAILVSINFSLNCEMTEANREGEVDFTSSGCKVRIPGNPDPLYYDLRGVFPDKETAMKHIKFL